MTPSRFLVHNEAPILKLPVNSRRTKVQNVFSAGAVRELGRDVKRPILSDDSGVFLLLLELVGDARAVHSREEMVYDSLWRPKGHRFWSESAIFLEYRRVQNDSSMIE